MICQVSVIDQLESLTVKKMSRNLNLQERAEIISLHRLGYNISDISRELNISRYTTRFWIRREGEEGNLQDHRRSGRPPALSSEQRETMRRQYEENGFNSTGDFAEEFDVTRETIRQHLHSMGLHYRRHAKKNYLTDANKAARLNFAREYLNFDWSTTIFTDEKTFKSSQHGRMTLWRYNNTRNTHEHIVPTTESGRISVNIWGWMSADGVGELSRLPPKANALDYVDNLENAMLPTVRNVYPESDLPQFNFLQDNCRLHTARVTRTWFDQHSFINLISWPSKSPDLNPIENLWGLMVQRWHHRNERTRDAIDSHCHEVWEALRGTDICSRLVGSMRSRLLAVIEANGGNTRY